MWIEVTTVGDLVDRAAAESDGDAVVFPDARATYAELSAQSDEFARSLFGLGVGRGDKVGILMPNCLDFVLALIGASKLGAIPVPINGRFKTHELGQVVEHSDARLVLTAAGPAGTADYPALLAASAPRECRIVDLGGGDRAEFEAAAGGIDVEEIRKRRQLVRVRDVALLMYTSGTTSRPKGCLLTHEAIVRHGANVARTRFLLTADDVFWDPLPLFHIGGIVPMLGCIAARATFVHAGHFEPGVALRTLQEERCTVAYPAFDMIWMAVLNHPDFATADLSRLRLIQSITTPERLAQLQAALPHAVEVSSYGATESSSNLTLPLPDDPYELRINTLGTPLPGLELKVVDPETGEERPTGTVGELCFRGYSLFEGYYKEPELTAAAIDADGWFHSGDLGQVREDGCLIYAGRLKDMLKVGGENVSALEVEDYLSRHPAVNIVQVVSAPDARYTEVPAAYVELKPGATVDADELIDYCVGKIASYKVPRYVRFVSEWPMSGTKIQKFVLREWIAEELRSAGITEAPRIDELSTIRLIESTGVVGAGGMERGRHDRRPPPAPGRADA
jgi:fatty-acyl-CoA synthase